MQEVAQTVSDEQDVETVIWELDSYLHQNRICSVGSQLLTDDRFSTVGFIRIWDSETYELCAEKWLFHDNDFYQSRITHCWAIDDGIMVLQQVDTHPSAQLNQSYINVMSLNWGLELLAEQTVLIPMDANQRLTMWVDLNTEERHNFFMDDHQHLHIKGWYRDIRLLNDIDHTFKVCFDQLLNPVTEPEGGV